MMQYLRFIPVILRLAHLLPDIRRLAEICRPLLQLAIKLWPEISPIISKIANDPAIQSLKSELALGELVIGQYDVKWLQASLNKLINARLAEDGVNGLDTIDAVKEFQRRMKLDVDGWAGAITSTAIAIELRKHGK